MMIATNAPSRSWAAAGGGGAGLRPAGAVAGQECECC